MVCVGTIIGAGFASGKELVSFFGDNGFWALIFIPVVLLLFFWCFYLFSKIGKMTKPKSISDMTVAVFGKAHIVVDFCFILCTFITLASMLAGCDSIGALAFGENYNFCHISILTAMIVVILLSVGLKWIYKVNNFILPMILISMAVVIISFLIVGKKPIVTDEYISFKPVASVVSCFLYVGMNIFTNIFIIAKTSSYLNKKQILLASALTSGVLCLFVGIILTCIFLAGDKVFLSDMPMVSIAYSISGFLGGLYSVVLWLAIFTTICLAGYSIQMWLNNYIKNKFLCAVITLTLGFVFSRFGFSTIVDFFYPLEGIFAFVMIVCCTAYYFKNKKLYQNYFNTQKQILLADNISSSLNYDINELTDKQRAKTENENKTSNNKMFEITNDRQVVEQVDSIKVERKNGKRIVTKKFKNNKKTGQ